MNDSETEEGKQWRPRRSHQVLLLAIVAACTAISFVEPDFGPVAQAVATIAAFSQLMERDE